MNDPYDFFVIKVKKIRNKSIIKSKYASIFVIYFYTYKKKSKFNTNSYKTNAKF